MNQPSIIRMFKAMTERVEAGEYWINVLHDYGLHTEVCAPVDCPLRPYGEP